MRWRLNRKKHNVRRGSGTPASTSRASTQVVTFAVAALACAGAGAGFLFVGVFGAVCGALITVAAAYVSCGDDD